MQFSHGQILRSCLMVLSLSWSSWAIAKAYPWSPVHLALPNDSMIVENYDKYSDIAYLTLLTSGGQVDTSFGIAGHVKLESDELPPRLALGSDKSIYVCYLDHVSHLFPDGTRDFAFGEGGSVKFEQAGYYYYLNQVTVDQEDHVLVVGVSGAANDRIKSRVFVTRLNSSGTIDSNFADGGTFSVDLHKAAIPSCENGCGLAIDSSNRLLLTADDNHPLGHRLMLSRFNSDVSFPQPFVTA